MDHPVNHSIGVVAGLGLVLGQAVADPNVFTPSTLAQITALAAALGTACFGMAAVIKAATEGFVKVREARALACPPSDKA